MSLKNQLLNAGMKENEFDTHCSDLYVLKNDISTKWINQYEFAENVTTFRSDIDGKLWFDIPFANIEYKR